MYRVGTALQLEITALILVKKSNLVSESTNLGVGARSNTRDAATRAATLCTTGNIAAIPRKPEGRATTLADWTAIRIEKLAKGVETLLEKRLDLIGKELRILEILLDGCLDTIGVVMARSRGAFCVPVTTARIRSSASANLGIRIIVTSFGMGRGAALVEIVCRSVDEWIVFGADARDELFKTRLFCWSRSWRRLAATCPEPLIFC